jgi:hypothetical protein
MASAGREVAGVQELQELQNKNRNRSPGKIYVQYRFSWRAGAERGHLRRESPCFPILPFITDLSPLTRRHQKRERVKCLGLLSDGSG